MGVARGGIQTCNNTLGEQRFPRPATLAFHNGGTLLIMSWLDETCPSISPPIQVSILPKNRSLINFFASCEVESTRGSSLAPRTGLELMVTLTTAKTPHESLPILRTWSVGRMAGVKRLHRGRVPAPHFLVIKIPRFPFPTSSNSQIMAGVAASKANRSTNTLCPLPHPKSLS